MKLKLHRENCAFWGIQYNNKRGRKKEVVWEFLPDDELGGIYPLTTGAVGQNPSIANNRAGIPGFVSEWITLLTNRRYNNNRV